MQKLITRGNSAGVARDEKFAAASDWSFGKRIPAISNPANVISAIDRFVQPPKSLLFHSQQKIARKLAAVQPRCIHQGGIKPSLRCETGLLGGVVNRAEEKAWIDGAVRSLFRPGLGNMPFQF